MAGTFRNSRRQSGDVWFSPTFRCWRLMREVRVSRSRLRRTISTKKFRTRWPCGIERRDFAGPHWRSPPKVFVALPVRPISLLGSHPSGLVQSIFIGGPDTSSTSTVPNLYTPPIGNVERLGVIFRNNFPRARRAASVLARFLIV